MDFTSQIPSETYQTLKCDICSKCLSHFPIYLSTYKPNIKNICGRCVGEPTPEEYSRNEVYEATAQYFKFPCCYKNDGCHENLFPTDVPVHELSCSFRTVKCPISKCDWKGPLPNVLHHCQDIHHDLMLKQGTIEFDLNTPHELEGLLEYESLLFIIKQKFCSLKRLVEFSIYNFEHDKKYSCEINFKKGTRIVAMPHSTSDSNEVMEEIFLESLKNREDSSSIVIEKIKFEDAISKETSNEPKVDEELLSELKCTHCKEYCLPPIYCVGDNASEGLVYCGECETSLSFAQARAQANNIFTTPQSNSAFGFNYTQSVFGATGSNSTPNASIFGSTISASTNLSATPFKALRNLTAEKMANHLNYPCRYKKNGCTFISKPPQMKQHLEFCSHGNHFCPLHQFVECKWQGMGKEIDAHIQDGHNNIILESSKISTNVSNNVSECKVIKFSNSFFRLNFEKKDKRFKWDVRIMGPFQNEFMFEVEIVDAYKGLMSKRPCSTLKKNNLFDDEIFFYYDQLQKFIVNNILTFKIQVYKQPFQRQL